MPDSKPKDERLWLKLAWLILPIAGGTFITGGVFAYSTSIRVQAQVENLEDAIDETQERIMDAEEIRSLTENVVEDKLELVLYRLEEMSQDIKKIQAALGVPEAQRVDYSYESPHQPTPIFNSLDDSFFPEAGHSKEPSPTGRPETH